MELRRTITKPLTLIAIVALGTAGIFPALPIRCLVTWLTLGPAMAGAIAAAAVGTVADMAVADTAEGETAAAAMAGAMAKEIAVATATAGTVTARARRRPQCRTTLPVLPEGHIAVAAAPQKQRTHQMTGRRRLVATDLSPANSAPQTLG